MGISPDRKPSYPHSFGFGVELAAEERNRGQQIHPDEQCHACSHAAVEHIVIRDMTPVPSEADGCQQPENGRQNRAWPYAVPALFAIGPIEVENRRQTRYRAK